MTPTSAIDKIETEYHWVIEILDNPCPRNNLQNLVPTLHTQKICDEIKKLDRVSEV